MAVKSRTDEKSGIPIPIIVVAVVALIAFMVWMGYRAFGPEPPVVNDLTIAHDKWLDELAKKSGGDISKLSAEEQLKLQKATFGHGEQQLQSWIKDHPIK